MPDETDDKDDVAVDTLDLEAEEEIETDDCGGVDIVVMSVDLVEAGVEVK